MCKWDGDAESRENFVAVSMEVAASSSSVSTGDNPHKDDSDDTARQQAAVIVWQWFIYAHTSTSFDSLPSLCVLYLDLMRYNYAISNWI